jgi:hypothetical protein
MIDKPIWKASKGKSYLKDIPLGSLFKVSGMRGILLNTSVSSASVIITEHNGTNKDDSFYLGKRLIAPKTEVVKL